MGEIAQNILPILSKYLKPALLGRMNVIPYKNLSIEPLKKIAKLKLGSLEKQMKSKEIAFTYDKHLLEHIVSLSNATETGARNLELIINNNLMPKLSKVLLDSMINESVLTSIHVSIDDSNAIHIESK